MADGLNTNPFFDDESIIEQETEEQDESKTKHGDTVDSSLDSIAAKLLKENFHLTALEFYTELVESGRELPRLRDYFSNPGNFERTRDDITSPSLPRTSSIQTFDSLDFARYSDDGGGQVDERVAVLEFELRKAQETIKSLRASLTKEAENEHGSTEHLNEGNITSAKDDQIKPLDKRALNFLVNEYLLMFNYKLTSVTFSEENEDQDFEDWDDVGLNIPRPPDLFHLYKDTSNYAVAMAEKMDVGCEVNFEEERLQQLTNEWTIQREQLELHILELENQIQKCNEDIQELQKVKETQIYRPENEMICNSTPIATNFKTNKNELNLSSVSENSYTLVGDAGITADRTEEDTINNGTTNDDPVVTDVNNAKHSDAESCDYVVIDTEDNGTEREKDTEDSDESVASSESDTRNLSPAFRKALSDVCFHVSKDNRIVNEVSKIVDSSKESMVYMLARCLPHIVPNVLLAKREELIPLIICTAMIHPDPKERDTLLNILFNLIKKPDDEQRQMILTGCIAYAQHAGHGRVEEELLPQCWEQISHKYIERRVLVAEACGALASYLPREILSSLILSMLQQMLSDDKAEEVREAVVRSLGLLFGFICDKDKYSQGYELLRTALKDSSEKVVISTQQTFLPSFATWAYELNKLEHNLIHCILKDLEELVKCAIAAQRASNSTTIPLNEGRFLILLSTLQELIPFLYLSVIRSGPYVSKLSEVIQTVTNVDMSRFPKASSPLTDLKIILGDKHKLSALVYLFEEHISQEWFEPWESLNWVVNNLLSRLLEVVMGAGLSIPRVVSLLCKCFFKISRMFGKVFVEKKLRPKFIEILVLSDDHSGHQDHMAAKQTSVTTCIVPVYAAGVLAAFNTEEDRQQLTQFLHEILITLSLYQAPLDSIKTAFTELNANSSNHDLLLGALWEGVVHTSAQVKATSARLLELMVKGVSSNLISSRVFPALVTLGSDPEISVRMATIPALGAIIENVSLVEMLDRVYMQFLTFMDDPIYRDEHNVHVEVIRTLSRVAPNAEPRFRDEFVLPRLALIAVNNNHQPNETRKREIALQLFEAYSALSCCFINDQLIQEAMLPGLRCLRQDMAHIAPEHDEVVLSIIKDYETKMEIVKHDRSGSATQGGSYSVDDVRSRVMNRIKDTTSKANLSNIFNRKK